MIFAILALVILVAIASGGRVRRHEQARRARLHANVAAAAHRVSLDRTDDARARVS